MATLSADKSPTDEPPSRPSQTLESSQPAPSTSESQPFESRVPPDTVADGISTQPTPAPSEPRPSEARVSPDTVGGGVSTQPAPAPSEPQSSESDMVGDGISTPASDLHPETLSEAEPTSEMSVPCDDQVTGVGMPTCEPPGVNPFAVGDLVWARAKSHHWCPAMVSDPSTALDPAKKTHRSLLVRFFGSGAFSWCEPAQLKPFVEEFHEMVGDRSSKNFVGAVEDALDVISRRRQSELTCRCLPPEAQQKHAGGSDGRGAAANFQPSEFLEHLGHLACDVTAIEVLQLQDLKGWAMAFGKGWRDGSPGYHPGRETLELVDKIDLDVPPGDLGDVSEEGDVECSIIGKGSKASKGSLQNIQRKRSMAALIAGMDVDTAEFSDGKEVKEKLKPRKRKGKFEDDEVNDTDAGFGDAQEETCSTRRERKKSKYLSPPYTSLAAGIKSLDSKGTAVLKSPRKNAETEPTLNSNFSALSTCSFKAEQDEDSGSPVLCMDGASMTDILSDFFSTATNPLHLQGKRLETMIRSFFSKYRSSMYSSGTDILTYQKNQDGSGDKNAGLLEKEILNNSCEVGTSTGEENANDAANLEIMTGFSADAMSNSKSDKAGKKRKMCNGELSVSSQKRKSGGKKKIELLVPSEETKSEQMEKSQVLKPSQVGKSRKKKKSKLPEPSQDSNSKQKESNLSQPSQEGKSEYEEESKLSQLSQEYKSEHEEESKLLQPSHRGTPELNEGGKLSQPCEQKASELLMLSPEDKSAQKQDKLSNPSQGGKSGQKKKKIKKKRCKPGRADTPLVNFVGDVTNGSQENKSDAEYYHSYPAALLLTFDPAVPLPSQNELISAFRKYGILIDSETELQKETNSARIVFAKSTDAEKAFNSSDKTGVFAPPYVSYGLRYLPPIAGSPHHTPPLPLIRDNLERMISTLSTASGPLDEMKPDARENLVGDMESLLKKVNTIINGDAPAPGA